MRYVPGVARAEKSTHQTVSPDAPSGPLATIDPPSPGTRNTTASADERTSTLAPGSAENTATLASAGR
jgi:hypothetical protein